MAARWLAAGNRFEMGVYPGGAHVFMAFPGAMSDESQTRIQTFLSSC